MYIYMCTYIDRVEGVFWWGRVSVCTIIYIGDAVGAADTGCRRYSENVGCG